MLQTVYSSSTLGTTGTAGTAGMAGAVGKQSAAGNGIISWSSKRQATVALSSTESEYMALTQASKEALWLQRLLDELNKNGTARTVTKIYADNQGCIALAKNPQNHARTKHIDIQHHFVRELVNDAADSGPKITLVYLKTDDMIVDALTKPLARFKHEKSARLMGINGKMGMA
jgi:hypothetical protein